MSKNLQEKNPAAPGEAAGVVGRRPGGEREPSRARFLKYNL
jgi:hypothetical protein